MSAAITTLIVSSSLLVFFSGLFLVERFRGARFLPRFRSLLDTIIGTGKQSIFGQAAHVNASFFRQLFHWIIHHVLTKVQLVLRVIERGIGNVVRFNRTKAKTIERTEASAHLSEVAEHKRSTQLSEKEREAHKERALRGE